jgi:hypothetical protein
MRNELKTGAALLTAVLFALPLTAGAADKATDKTAPSTMDKMENKAKETTQEVTGATSDIGLTSETKIASSRTIGSGPQSAGRDRRRAKCFLRGRSTRRGEDGRGRHRRTVEGVRRA